MSNDISGELHKHISTNPVHAKMNSKSMPQVQNDDIRVQNNYSNEQNYLSMLGRAKVNIDKATVNNRVASSVEAFKLIETESIKLLNSSATLVL